jgi:hypothetical protein
MYRLVIIGAGASIDASNSKLPSATNFFGCIRNHPELSKELESQHIRDTLTSLLPLSLSDPMAIKALDKLNIEDLFTLASLEAEMDVNDKRVWYLTELIRKTIVTCSSEVKGGGGYSAFVEEMLDDQTSVISFNWDILLDEVLARDAGGLHREYCRICLADNTFESFSGERPPPLKQFVAKPAYLKLHGSVDVVVCRNQHCGHYQLPFRVVNCTDEHYCQDCYEKVAPFIVPPVQNKPIRQFHHIRRAWMLASKLIQQAEEVIVWGYSLPTTDHWSHWLMGRIWSRDACCRKVVIINPQAVTTNRRKQIRVPRMDFIKRFVPWRSLAARKIEVEVYEYYDLYVKGEAIMVR